MARIILREPDLGCQAVPVNLKDLGATKAGRVRRDLCGTMESAHQPDAIRECQKALPRAAFRQQNCLTRSRVCNKHLVLLKEGLRRINLLPFLSGSELLHASNL